MVLPFPAKQEGSPTACLRPWKLGSVYHKYGPIATPHRAGRTVDRFGAQTVNFLDDRLPLTTLLSESSRRLYCNYILLQERHQGLSVRLSLFDYDLPTDLIAQQPLAERSASRMLVLHRDDGVIEHRRFTDLPEYLAAQDCVIINQTRVIPARLLGRRSTGGQVELLLIEPLGNGRWEVLARPAGRLSVGERIDFSGEITATIEEEMSQGRGVVSLECPGELMTALNRVGLTPLPPYIHRDQQPPSEASSRQQAQEAADQARYQTVYAREPGAVAAPTAGLHFEQAMLDQLAGSGVEIVRITLHVGLGTFRPVRVENIEEHDMDAERYEVTTEAARIINACRADGGRIVAVGTTVVRTLETLADESGQIAADSGETRLFAYPGYRFRAVDMLLTNFHLPRSTLLMLISAFAGRERVLAAYREAISRRYRFYSYGDCMLII